MFVYGGSLVESESITDELWQLDFTTLTWMKLYQHDNNRSLNNSNRNEDFLFTSSVSGAGIE